MADIQDNAPEVVKQTKKVMRTHRFTAYTPFPGDGVPLVTVDCEHFIAQVNDDGSLSKDILKTAFQVPVSMGKALSSSVTLNDGTALSGPQIYEAIALLCDQWRREWAAEKLTNNGF